MNRKIVGIVIALALLSISMSIGTVVDYTVFAKKGETAFHISTQGAENQSPQGAASSGRICGGCG